MVEASCGFPGPSISSGVDDPLSQRLDDIPVPGTEETFAREHWQQTSAVYDLARAPTQVMESGRGEAQTTSVSTLTWPTVSIATNPNLAPSMLDFVTSPSL